MRRAIAITLAGGVFAGPALAQLVLGQNFELTLRRASSGASAEKAALFSYTKPADRPSSSATDLALGLGYVRASEGLLTTASVFAEMHRNTALGKEQDKRAFGVTIESIFNVDAARNWTLLPDLTLSDQRDDIANSRATSALLQVRVRSKPLGIGDVLGPKQFPFMYTPTLSWETLRAKADNGQRGRLGRYGGSLLLEAFPGGYSETGTLWTATLQGEAWRENSESGTMADGRKRQYYREAGLSYRFAGAENQPAISIGLRRVSGEHPVQGLAKQKFTQATFEIKY